jgi:hypothetical protein
MSNVQPGISNVQICRSLGAVLNLKLINGEKPRAVLSLDIGNSRLNIGHLKRKHQALQIRPFRVEQTHRVVRTLRKVVQHPNWPPHLHGRRRYCVVK